MNLSKVIQKWNILMAKKIALGGKRPAQAQLQIQLIPTNESTSEFQSRKEEVQVLLTNMFLQVRKRGRPKKNEEGESNAA